MSETEFDTALISAALQMAAEEGWNRVSVPAACRAAGLPLSEARMRFPSRSAILLKFGRLMDQVALTDAPTEGPVRDRLFDLLMRRFDAMQAYRLGIKALLRSLQFDPPTALLLASATRNSMRWMLQAAGVNATGLMGDIQVQGLVAVWLWCLRTWEKDETEDLSGTMAVVDAALGRAERVASWMGGGSGSPPAPPPPSPVAGAGEIDPSDPVLATDIPPESSLGTPPAPLNPTPMIDPAADGAPGLPRATPPAPLDPTPMIKPLAEPDE